MRLPEIENLLLQEMEDVKGGFIDAICTCDNGGAGVSNDPHDNCTCANGGAAAILPTPPPSTGTCTCPNGGAAYK